MGVHPPVSPCTFGGSTVVVHVGGGVSSFALYIWG